MIQSSFQDKIGSINRSFAGDFLNIRLLTPDAAEEYAALRLEALRFNPERVLIPILLESAACGSGYAHSGNLEEVKASSKCIDRW